MLNKARHLLKINSFPEKYASNVIKRAQEKIIEKFGLDEQEQQAANSKRHLPSLTHIPKLTNKIKHNLET